MAGLLLIAMVPTAEATHGESAYLVGKSRAFYSESRYVGGPGFLDQYWDFFIASDGGPDFCRAMHGGWDPYPDGSGVPGFKGVCDSGKPFHVTGIDHYHPYPYPQGIDIHDVTVTHGGEVYDVTVVICDTPNPRLRSVLGTCDNLLVLSQL